MNTRIAHTTTLASTLVDFSVPALGGAERAMATWRALVQSGKSICVGEHDTLDGRVASSSAGTHAPISTSLRSKTIPAFVGDMKTTQQRRFTR